MSNDVQSLEEADLVRPLAKDRPIYECPECGQMAMQFYEEAPDGSERQHCFLCHACGRTWEM